MNRVLFFLTFLAPIALFTLVAAKKGDVNKTFMKNVAMDFYDPVAYHTTGRAAKGDKKVRSKHDGAYYHFISHTNLKQFEESPRGYIPAYGGYCAYGVAQDGSRNQVDPTVWSIRDGTLYLFAGQKQRNEFDLLTRSEIRQADENWNN